MERTLFKMIPLISFHDIPSEEFCEKVMPYDELLPKKLRHELLTFYLAPEKLLRPLSSRYSFSINIDSVIINAQHMPLFSNWIDRKDEPLKKNPYKFNLILRASRDGGRAADFHVKCNDQGATIVVAKIKETDRVVGGYNPLDWKGNRGSKCTPDSFIFSFENYNDINTGIIGRVIQENMLYVVIIIMDQFLVITMVIAMI
ncbi:hypothetical protein C1645_791212 [Glomus cerebriforme]|uniref:TLDc domain-containing protein n=1 Tax=Glomus cerebriforme TaxID=658196 RepID=A0A397SAT9_9GLOM|nr:hypothetical protein C1645_791212 [Glomus cerebriforme]